MKAMGSLLLLLVLGGSAGCGKYYYGDKPGGDFRADSAACIDDIGIASSNKQVALVAKEPYRRCMLAKGWVREQRVDTVGWHRGIEEDQQVIDLAAGAPQPPASSSGAGSLSRQQVCRQTWLSTHEWRKNLASPLDSAMPCKSWWPITTFRRGIST